MPIYPVANDGLQWRVYSTTNSILEYFRTWETAMAYSHTNKKGVTYYLHANERATKSGKVTKLYFFSRDVRPGKEVEELPEGRTVVETDTGMLVLKKG